MKHFINLTNGIQAIKDYNLTDYHFIRLQSTACEQKRFEEILLTISDEFLLYAALGEPCVVYDYGANKEIPRAVWQGLEWIKYALSARWHGRTYFPIGRAGKGLDYFEEQYNKLGKRAKARLDYFKTYLNGELFLFAVTSKTGCDGNREYYARILRGEPDYDIPEGRKNERILS